MGLIAACFRALEGAVAKATGDDRYQVPAPTLFYHVRPLLRPCTAQGMRSDYFEQKVLPVYQRERGAIRGLNYEPRGSPYEPHSGAEVPLGTRGVQTCTFQPRGTTSSSPWRGRGCGRS
jgi:hypothetical protein